MAFRAQSESSVGRHFNIGYLCYKSSSSRPLFPYRFKQKEKKKHVRGDKTAMRTCPSLVNAYISCRLHILPYNQTCAPSLVDAPLIFRVHLQTFIIVIPAHSMIEKKKENKLTCVCIIVREYLLSCEPTLRARGHYNSVQVWPETRRKVQG